LERPCAITAQCRSKAPTPQRRRREGCLANRERAAEAAWAACVFGAAAACLSGGAAACGSGLPGTPQRIENERVVLAWRSDPAPIPLGRHFRLELELCPRAGMPMPAELRVDALMPEHRHGMNYRAGIVPLGGGRFRADGLLFHMPGRWDLVFELRDSPAAVPQRLVHTIQLQ
jgi:hypothetical protein